MNPRDPGVPPIILLNGSIVSGDTVSFGFEAPLVCTIPLWTGVSFFDSPDATTGFGLIQHDENPFMAFEIYTENYTTVDIASSLQPLVLLPGHTFTVDMTQTVLSIVNFYAIGYLSIAPTLS